MYYDDPVVHIDRYGKKVKAHPSAIMAALVHDAHLSDVKRNCDENAKLDKDGGDSKYMPIFKRKAEDNEQNFSEADIYFMWETTFEASCGESQMDNPMHIGAARHSPGEVLKRHLLEAKKELGAKSDSLTVDESSEIFEGVFRDVWRNREGKLGGTNGTSIGGDGETKDEQEEEDEKEINVTSCDQFSLQSVTRLPPSSSSSVGLRSPWAPGLQDKS